jgi:hypothetical protein
VIAQGPCSEKADAEARQAGPFPRSGSIGLLPVYSIAGWRLSPDQVPDSSLYEVMTAFHDWRRDMAMLLCVARLQGLLGEMV